MLFHSFASQSERRQFGGGDFVELQYCQLEHGTAIETILSTDTLQCWKADSLYIFGDDWNVFCDNYGEIITDGIYANLESGYLDGFGINYFTPEQTAAFIKCIKNQKPMEYKTLVSWLERQNNGFYVLGL